MACWASTPFAGPRNPVDITGQATSDPALLSFAGELMGESGCYDSVMVFLAAAGMADALWRSFGESLLRTRQRFPDLVVAVARQSA